MVSIKIQKLFMLSLILLAGWLLWFPAKQVSAGIVICNNGTIHHTPGSDYACAADEDEGFQSVVGPGSLCPLGPEFERSGQKVPDGETGDWCDPNDTDGSVTPSADAPYYIAGDCQETASLDQNNCGIVKYLVIIINILSALAGIAITASVIIGGIQYTTAGSDPQKVSAAKNRIRNTIIAMLFFIFGYALLNYLIPGGVL